MILLGFRRKLTALALCKSIESAIQWFQIHHRITFATIRNPAVYLSGARVSIFSTLVPRLHATELIFHTPAWLSKWNFLVHSTTGNGPYIQPAMIRFSNSGCFCICCCVSVCLSSRVMFYSMKIWRLERSSSDNAFIIPG